MSAGPIIAQSGMVRYLAGRKHGHREERATKRSPPGPRGDCYTSFAVTSLARGTFSLTGPSKERAGITSSGSVNDTTARQRHTGRGAVRLAPSLYWARPGPSAWAGQAALAGRRVAVAAFAARRGAARVLAGRVLASTYYTTARGTRRAAVARAPVPVATSRSPGVRAAASATVSSSW